MVRTKIYAYSDIIKDREKFNEVIGYIEKYGNHCMAYSILQPKMNYYIEEGIGLIAYAKFRKNSEYKYILSDPLVSRDKKELFIKIFLKSHKKSFFIQVSANTAKMLNNIGFYATPMGIITQINTNNFDLNTNKKKSLRNNIRNCKKELKVFEEQELEYINLNQIESISRDWLKYQKKNKKELRFLARPFTGINEKETRKFYAVKGEDIVGFGIFNPIYQDNRIIGFCPDIFRVASKSPRGTSDYILYLALKKFKREGIQLVDLGLSPFHNLKGDKLNMHDKSTLKLLDIIYNKANFLYSFQGLADHKKQFEGKEEHVYFCHKNKFPIIDIIKLFRICNAI